MAVYEPFPEIRTERLLLRELVHDDNHALFAMRSDERLMKFLDRPPALSLTETDLFLRTLRLQFLEGRSIIWAICQKADPELMGTITLWKIDGTHFRAELGYMLAFDRQRRGFMQESVAAVLNFGFSRMNLHSIQAEVNPLNFSSVKILERAGFTREAHFKEYYYCQGHFLDTAIYSILSPHPNSGT